MTRLRVDCIRRSGSNLVGQGIVAIGGSYQGQRWIYTEPEAIRIIRSGTASFYVDYQGNQVDVIIAATHGGKEFLKTERDGYAENNLLNLPECP